MNGPAGSNNDSPNPPRKVAWKPAGGQTDRTETTDTGATSMKTSDCIQFGVCVWTDKGNGSLGGKWECVSVDDNEKDGRESFRRYVRQDMGRECVLMGMDEEDGTMVVAGYLPRWDEVSDRHGTVTPHVACLNRVFLKAVCEVIDNGRLELA